MIRKITAGLVCSLCVFNWAQADIKPGYYNTIDGKKDRELKTALSKILVNHTVLNYNNLWYYYRTTDIRDNGTVWDMYSDVTRYFNGNNSVSGMNREHSFPKSWWAVSDATDEYDAYSDLNHLYPADADANNAKSNYILGVVGTYTFYNGVSKVGKNTFPGGSTNTAFEPADEYKGDFARTYLYMVTCYEDYAQQWRSDGLFMMNKEKYPVWQTWAKNMLLQWHRNDEVSKKERDRNDAVFLAQGNRNPFIDMPQLVEYIWGDSIGYPFPLPEEFVTQRPNLFSPENGTDLFFGEFLPGTVVEEFVNVKGVNMTGDVTVKFTNNTSGYFSFSAGGTKLTIPRNSVNSEEGYKLAVKYSPLEYGEHTAALTVYDGGIVGSVNLNLTGICSMNSGIEVPVGAQSADWYVQGRDIVYRTYEPGTSVALFNIQGQLLFSGKGDGDWQYFTCPVQGIYILKINNKTIKIVVNNI